MFDRWVETSPATNFNGRIKCNHRFYRQKRWWKVNLWRSQSSFETSRRKGILQQYHSAIVWINFVINSTVIVQNFRRKKKEGSTKNQKRTHQINLQQIHLEKKKIWRRRRKPNDQWINWISTVAAFNDFMSNSIMNMRIQI